ncbi:MAG: DUF481 domain-containing protein [Alphaproteobacteria bacterium]|nr:DUF481 domain-containing protein [Alphaproteobacteria bacterium]
MIRTRSFMRLGLLVLGAVLFVHAGTARGDAGGTVPDEVKVKGQVLKGRVVGLDEEGVQLDTIYGKGTLTIPYKLIETVRTRGAYRVYDQGDQKVIGRLIGVRQQALLVGNDAATAEPLPFGSIHTGVPEAAYQTSFQTRLEAHTRNWRGDVNLGIDFEQTAIDKRKFRLGFNVERPRRPTTLEAGFDFAFETEEAEGQPERTTKDELALVVQGTHDVVGDLYAFVLPGLDRDAPRRLEIRTFPSAGLGYHLIDRDNLLLRVQGGFGHIFESFASSPSRDFAAASLGGRFRYMFSSGTELGFSLLYMPGLSNPGRDWLLRSRFDLSVPLGGPLALRYVIRNVNSQNPFGEIGNNKFETLLSLSYQF